MKLWLFDRNEDKYDDVDYDEYDKIAVLAETEAEAREIVAKGDDGTIYGYALIHAPVKEIDMTKPGVVLDSFRAG